MPRPWTTLHSPGWPLCPCADQGPQHTPHTPSDCALTAWTFVFLINHSFLTAFHSLGLRRHSIKM